MESTSDDGKVVSKKKNLSKKALKYESTVGGLIDLSLPKKQQGFKGGKSTIAPHIQMLLHPSLPETLK